MNDLIIDNHIIKRDLKEILNELKNYISPGKLRSIKIQQDNVWVTCPVHKDGQENTPSCDIYIGDSENVVWGTTHCFACGFKGQLYDFIAECCDRSQNWGKKWLKDNFTEQILDEDIIEIDEPINLNKKVIKKTSFENITLDNYQNWHPYMQQRKLSKNVCEKFDIKYDPRSECIVFPVKDVKGRLKFLTRRSIKSKKFIIDKDIEKEVYLLYNIINEGIKEVIVTESQINCLTCWSYNLPSIALLGTGTEYQYELLKKSGIIHYILCFDGDEAGRKGRDKFIQNLGDNVFITVVNLPEGKDVNDLNKEEFIQLLDESGLDYNNLVTKYLNLSKGD